MPVLIGPLAAQTAAPDGFAGGAESPPPPMPAAIGRISYGVAHVPGAAICTGALIAPDLILTAGHCVTDADPGALRFDAGLADGGSLATARGLAVFRPAPPLPGLAGDVALVRLDHALPDSIAPLPLAPDRVQATAFTLFAYRRDAPGRAQYQDCRLLARQPSVLGLTCDVVSGNSGAPLLMDDGTGGWQIAAVMVAQDLRNLLIRSWAVVPPADMATDAGFGSPVSPP